ncbi:hypothetical protein GOODEAATRI_025280 [Goodea atripinnis]|uniref:Uncharacterized protein n=1 Tax=Goodea atripinnis TaxID=208336 RepID=A0ABV0P7N9_9TELE
MLSGVPTSPPFLWSQVGEPKCLLPMQHGIVRTQYGGHTVISQQRAYPRQSGVYVLTSTIKKEHAACSTRMYSTAAPPPLAVSLRPSATACLSNRTSSSAYCPLPAALTPFATAEKASVTERRRGESESWVQIQDQTSEEALLSCCFFVSFPSARRPADSSCFTSFPFTSPEFHHRPARW